MRATVSPLTFILSPSRGLPASGGGEENVLGAVGQPVVELLGPHGILDH